jgi:endoglucanase
MTEPMSDDSIAEQANRLLARTINMPLSLGGRFESGWTLPFDPAHTTRCAEAGFTAVRLVVTLADHPTKSGALSELDRAIDDAVRRGLAVVVANMTDPQLMADPAAHRERSLTDARDLAAAIDRHGPTVVLEPLAEPQHALDPIWNDYARELCGVVRDVDPDRTLLVGPRTYNNARFLADLDLPDAERNLIVTVHHYWPIPFTMQGETWVGPNELGDPASWLGTTWDATPQQRAELEVGFDAVAAFAHSHRRPIFLGEFGTTSNADMASRVRWTRFNRELAEYHGFSWGCWSLAPTFALYDTRQDHWHHALLDALIPTGQQPRPAQAPMPMVPR